MARRTKKKGFSYRGHTEADMKDAMSAARGIKDPMFETDREFFKPQPGKSYKVRILPVPADVLEKDERYQSFAYPISVNYGVGPDNRRYLSLSAMKNERDPVAELRARMLKAGDTDAAKELAPRQQFLMYVIVQGEESKGAQLWMCPPSAFRSIVDLIFDEDEGTMPIDHPTKGHWVRFKREPGEPRYSGYEGFKVLSRSGPISEDPEEQETILTYVVDNPLDGILKFYDYDHIEKQLLGDVADDDDDDDDDDEYRTSSNGDDEDEDDEDDEDDEEEDDDEDEEEEDDEEDDEDEEEEDDEEDEEDDEEEDEEEEDEDEDDDEDDEEEDDDEDDEEEDDDEDDEEDDDPPPAPPKPRSKKKAAKKKAATSRTKKATSRTKKKAATSRTKKKATSRTKKATRKKKR